MRTKVAQYPALEQAPLFDESQLPAGRELLLPLEEQRHKFSAEIVARNVQKYRAIVAALGEGLGVRQIARAFGVSHHTVSTVREREAALVATEKERTGRKLRRLLAMSLESLEESLELGLIPHSQRTITVGILADKSLLWDGQATAIVAHRHELDQEKVRQLFAALHEPATVIDVTASDLESGAIGPSQAQKEMIPAECGTDVVNSCPPAPFEGSVDDRAALETGAQAEMAGGGGALDTGGPDGR